MNLPPHPRRLLTLMLLGFCASGCETYESFRAVSNAVYGDELRVLYRYEHSTGLLGTHTSSADRIRYVLYGIDLKGRGRGSASAVDTSPAVKGGEATPDLVASSDRWLLESYDPNRGGASVAAYDPVARRVFGETVLLPAYIGDQPFGGDWAAFSFTPSHRLAVGHEGGRVFARDTLAGTIDLPGLTELVRLCHDVVCRYQISSRPLYSDDLEFLVVRPNPIRPRRPFPYAIANVQLDANDHGFFGERTTVRLRPYPLARDGLHFVTANSVRGRLRLVYIGAQRVLVTDQEGHGEQRFEVGNAPELPGYTYESAGYEPLLWDSVGARLIVSDGSGAIAVLHLDSGQMTRVRGASDEAIIRATQ